ncbi:MAG: ACP S-malonyltransferase [Candidatus Kerfeldbacteria bacterium]
MTNVKPIAFLFPGQASEFADGYQELYDKYQVVRDTFKISSLVLGIDIADLCFNGTDEDLSLTSNTQPVILTASIAAWRVFYEETAGKINVIGMAGHSLGEYSALVVSGVISFEDAISIVRLRGLAMQEAADKAGDTMMAAIIGLSYDQINTICDEPIEGDVLSIANYNSPKQVVISGHSRSVLAAGEKVRKLKGKLIPLKVSAPFHSSIMEPVESVLLKQFENTNFHKPRIPVIKNTDAMPYRGAWEVPQTLSYQATSPVLWDVSVNSLIRMGAQELYVPCPSKVIVNLMRQIDKSIPVYGIDDLKTLTAAINQVR